MLVLEIVDGNGVLVQRDTLTLEDIQRFVKGPIEGASLSPEPEAQSLIAYVNAEGYHRFTLRENCFLLPRQVVYGPMLIVGIGPGGTDRGLTPDELDRIQLVETPRSPLPTLVFGSR